MKIERFEDIEAWRLARELTRKVYRLTKKTRFAKDYGLKRQIQDAAGSSMHNIAEGFDSETNVEFMRFLRYSKRSCTEVQSELYVALDEEYIVPSEFEDVYEQARRIPPRRDCSWLYQLPEEIRRAKDLNNREPLNREPDNLCSYELGP
ncbi:four helix bundle protein [Thermodesulfobacteriota bacterium]